MNKAFTDLILNTTLSVGVATPVATTTTQDYLMTLLIGVLVPVCINILFFLGRLIISYLKTKFKNNEDITKILNQVDSKLTEEQKAELIEKIQKEIEEKNGKSN